MKIHIEKRIAAMVMTVVLLFCCCSVVYADDKERESGDFKYKIKGNGTAIITKYNHTFFVDHEIYIPQLIDGYTVTEIGAYAFSSEENKNNPLLLKGMSGWCHRLYIPDTVTVIGEMAFYGSSISRCDIPASVKHIGLGAFGGTIINEHYVDKENETFATIDGILYNKKTKELVSCPVDKGGKEKIVIPNGIVSIGDFAFVDCNLYGGIEIPDTLVSIGDYAFFHTYFNEPNFIFNSKVETIGKYAFAYCMYNDDRRPWYKDGVAQHFEGHTYLQNDSWNITLPETLKEMGEYAYYNYGNCSTDYNNEKLKTYGALSYVQSRALHTDQFNTIDLSKTQLTVIPKGAFQDTGYREGEECFLLLPNQLETIEDDAFLDDWFQKEYEDSVVCWIVQFPSSLKKIGKHAFRGKRLLFTFEDNSRLNSIDDEAFYITRYENEELILPNGVKTIGEKALYFVYSNIILSLPDTITSLGEEFCNKEHTQLTVEEGSYAELYASENGYIILHDEDTSWLNN